MSGRGYSGNGNHKTVTLGDIFEIARGGSPRPIDKFITDDPSAMNWVLIGDAKSKYITSTKKRITKEGTKKSREVRPGDFLLTNSMSFGRPYIMQTTGCIHDGWLVLSPRGEDTHPDYFYHLLSSDHLYAEFERRASGATVKNLNIEMVKSVQVPFPSLNEQRRVASVLDKADELRAKRRATLAELDTLTQSIFLEMFGDPTANANRFPVHALESLLRQPLQNGAYYPKDAYTEDAGVEMVHMSDAFYEVVPRGNLKRVNCAKTDVQKYALTELDILVARRSLTLEGAAKPCLIPKSDEPLIFESSFIRVTPHPGKITALYLYHYLANERIKRKRIQPYITQSTISGINQSNLARVLVTCPPVILQQDFACRAAAIESLKAKHQTALAELDALFASLQHRAFCGNL